MIVVLVVVEDSDDPYSDGRSGHHVMRLCQRFSMPIGVCPIVLNIGTQSGVRGSNPERLDCPVGRGMGPGCVS